MGSYTYIYIHVPSLMPSTLIASVEHGVSLFRHGRRQRRKRRSCTLVHAELNGLNFTIRISLLDRIDDYALLCYTHMDVYPCVCIENVLWSVTACYYCMYGYSRCIEHLYIKLQSVCRRLFPLWDVFLL